MKNTLARPIALTKTPGYAFFGYYEKCPWNHDGQWLLAMKSSFMDRPPTEHDQLEIGLIDLANDNRWEPLAHTHAWNWQQGCMLRWLEPEPNRYIAFNDLEEGRFVSRILEVQTGKIRTLPLPFYTADLQGKNAYSVSFSRLQDDRPGYGYPGVPDPFANEKEPAGDGLYAIDIASGESRLILSVAEVASMQRTPDMDGAKHRFNHVQVSPEGSRVAFLHRYKQPEDEVGLTRLVTANPDGSDIRIHSGPGLFSHYDWRDETHLIGWAGEREGDAYYYYDTEAMRYEKVGANTFWCDGHCSYAPDRRWLMTDTYPDANHMRTLMLFDTETETLVPLGKYLSPPVSDWQIRCDLHPRWNRDGSQVCFDSVHEGERRLYTLDVSDITKA